MTRTSIVDSSSAHCAERSVKMVLYSISIVRSPSSGSERTILVDSSSLCSIRCGKGTLKDFHYHIAISRKRYLCGQNSVYDYRIGIKHKVIGQGEQEL